MSDELNELLRRLHEELARKPVVDDEARRLLSVVVGDIQTLGDLATLSTAVAALRSMDERRLADRLSELDYEREWWAVYRALDSTGAHPQRSRRR